MFQVFRLSNAEDYDCCQPKLILMLVVSVDSHFVFDR